jgi:putative transposase
MPEHVHLLLSEPEKDTLADAIHFLKLSFTKRLRSQVSAQQRGANLGHAVEGSFWQKRYYDRNVRNHEEFINDLKYIHRNPVKRGLVEKPEDWPWSSYRHYALHEQRIVVIESPWAAYKRKYPSADPNDLSRIFAKDE